MYRVLSPFVNQTARDIKATSLQLADENFEVFAKLRRGDQGPIANQNKNKEIGRKRLNASLYDLQSIIFKIEKQYGLNLKVLAVIFVIYN